VNTNLPTYCRDNLSPMVYNELSRFPPAKQEEFLYEFQRKKKSIGIAYLLWFIAGTHYIYLGEWGLWVLNVITVRGMFVWAVIDLFRIPSMVREYNREVGINIMRNMKIIYNNPFS
jgi:hypothetical protein